MYKSYLRSLALVVPASTITGFAYSIAKNSNNQYGNKVALDVKIKNVIYLTGIGCIIGATYPISIPYIVYKELKKYK